ncbi:hypothetical protein A7E78_14090 [Syntrophotalea acetylenivorans]|uniref:Uncharacterized protein n=1 Tax=Syntrophotalea acetylenivorans TaxID=1842532 RepID=A0A1L3GSF9_9BACT|nr:hypothetical protein [Syntrophotalea acetylenivorans]APG28861.1 hypothetical protein A7E78_14090 [Syntrophotalea acetylenivorans]
MFEQNQVVKVFCRGGQVVVHHHQGLARFLGSLQHVENRSLGGRIDSGKGFVKQQDIRSLRQGPGQKYALLLPAGKLADLALGEVLHADHA